MEIRGKYFKPENIFEKGIFAWASTADANSPCTELKCLCFNMVVNESLKACFQPSPQQVSLPPLASTVLLETELN